MAEGANNARRADSRRAGLAGDRRVGTTLVVHEWTKSGPSWLHVHRSDDEAWHVLEGALRFASPIAKSTPLQAPRSSCPPARRTPTG